MGVMIDFGFKENTSIERHLRSLNLDNSKFYCTSIVYLEQQGNKKIRKCIGLDIPYGFNELKEKFSFETINSDLNFTSVKNPKITTDFLRYVDNNSNGFDMLIFGAIYLNDILVDPSQDQYAFRVIDKERKRYYPLIEIRILINKDCQSILWVFKSDEMYGYLLRENKYTPSWSVRIFETYFNALIETMRPILPDLTVTEIFWESKTSDIDGLFGDWLEKRIQEEGISRTDQRD